MSDETKGLSDSERAIQEALASVERLERERKETIRRKSGRSDSAAEESVEMSDIDLDSVTVLQPSDTPPSADPNDVSGNKPLDDPRKKNRGTDDEVLTIDDAEKPAARGPKSDPILEAMIAAKNEAVELLAQTQKEAQSFRERLQRVSADFENYKKRQEREKSDSIKFANESLLKDVVPVLDNLERALSGMRDVDLDTLPVQAKALMEGVSLVYKQFEDTLSKFGVRVFHSEGEPFDPAKHEAVAAREDTSVPSQTVIEEYQRGFFLAERLVRPAMVIVSTGGPPRGKTPAASDGDSSRPDNDNNVQ